MHDIAVLRDLLESVVAAKGPIPELDALILCALLAPSGSKVEKGRFNDAWCVHEPVRYGKYPFRLWEKPRQFGEITASIDATVALLNSVLPGWVWKAGTCSVSDDAWVAPDRNGPDACLLQDRQFDEGFDVDRRPSGNVPLALIEAMLLAKIALAERAGNGESGG